jgi:hypothetical protein
MRRYWNIPHSHGEKIMRGDECKQNRGQYLYLERL